MQVIVCTCALCEERKCSEMIGGCSIGERVCLLFGCIVSKRGDVLCVLFDGEGWSAHHKEDEGEEREKRDKTTEYKQV